MNLTLESLITLCGFIALIGSIIWKTAEIKESLKKDFDDRLDNYKETIFELQAKIDLLGQKFDNEYNSINNRVSNLHSYSKDKIKSLQYQFNEIVGYLEKISPENKFIVRSRVMDKTTYNDESWTQIQKKN